MKPPKATLLLHLTFTMEDKMKIQRTMVEAPKPVPAYSLAMGDVFRLTYGDTSLDFMMTSMLECPIGERAVMCLQTGHLSSINMDRLVYLAVCMKIEYPKV